MTTNLAISPGTMMQLTTIAKEEGTTPQILGEKAIRRYLRHEIRRKIQREEDAFRAMHAELLNTHLGQWVAVHRGHLVDSDTDLLALFQRIEQHYAETPVLIRQVTPEPEEIYVFRSPRVDEP